MIDMMQAVIDHGTGRRLRYAYDMKGPIAGKQVRLIVILTVGL